MKRDPNNLHICHDCNEKFREEDMYLIYNDGKECWICEQCAIEEQEYKWRGEDVDEETW